MIGLLYSYVNTDCVFEASCLQLKSGFIEGEVFVPVIWFHRLRCIPEVVLILYTVGHENVNIDHESSCTVTEIP